MHFSRFAAQLTKVVMTVGLATACIAPTPAAAAPDPNKIVHISFPAAEA